MAASGKKVKKRSPGRREGSGVDHRARAEEIVRRLSEAYAARIELNFSGPLELAIATILSAQSVPRPLGNNDRIICIFLQFCEKIHRVTNRSSKFTVVTSILTID